MTTLTFIQQQKHQLAITKAQSLTLSFRKSNTHTMFVSMKVFTLPPGFAYVTHLGTRVKYNNKFIIVQNN